VLNIILFYSVRDTQYSINLILSINNFDVSQTDYIQNYEITKCIILMIIAM